MDAIERIKELCRKNGTNISQIEKKFGYGNGSLAKGKDIPSKRLYEISKFFNVSMEYIVSGETGSATSLTFEERSVLEAYRKQSDSIKDAICKLLDIKKDLLSLKEA